MNLKMERVSIESSKGSYHETTSDTDPKGPQYPFGLSRGLEWEMSKNMTNPKEII